MSAAARGHREGGRDWEIVTPEGVPLVFTLARAGDRAAAFLIDFVLLAFGVIAILLLARLAGSPGGDWTTAFALLVSFLMRNFYFTWFELRWHGATPGKRKIGIRVIDGDGGQLSADAVFARNFMREIEIWLPLSLLLAPESLWPSAPGWARVAASVWAFLLVLMPIFNRQRMRAGDMVAGTRVVVAPQTVLLRDLGGQELERRARQGAAFAFTDEQLDVYGIYELQVLEDVLRGSGSANRKEALRTVCRKIQKKIKWDRSHKPLPERFLREFYAALRARLEKKMLLGKRKEDKFSD